MSIVNRAKNILLNPSTEWQVIANEPATPMGLLTGYAIPIAGIAAIIGIIAALLFGAALASIIGAPAANIGLVSAIISGIVGFILSMALVLVMGFLVAAIGPSFGGSSDATQGSKLIIYSGTAVWVASFFAIIPLIGLLVWIAGLFYACYLIAIGVGPIMGVPQDKMAGITVVTLLVYLVGALIVFGMNFAFSTLGLMASSAAIS